MIEVITTSFPSLYFTNEESARNEASKLGVEVCKIIFVDTWNNQKESHFMGYGLYDGKLLGTKDFINVHF